MPLIRHTLALTYGQVGLLVSAPQLIGTLLELPLGILAGSGRARRLTVLAGGLLFTAGVAAVSAARSFGWLLAAFAVCIPASAAFVTLTQSSLMDADPQHQSRNMARWTVAGAVGAVAGPLAVAGLVAVGSGWRSAFALFAGCGAVAWLSVLAARPPSAAGHGGEPHGSRATRVRQLARGLRHRETVRWLLLLRVADLLLDVFTGYLALYLVDVAHTSAAAAAVGVAIRLAAGLLGYAALIPALARLGDLRALRISSAAAAVIYPGFLLVPGIGAKLALLALLSFATAPWYPVMQAQLYASQPGRSHVVVSLAGVAGLAASAAPFVIGALAQWLGLARVLTLLTVVPPVIVLALPRRRVAGRRGG